MLPSNKSLLQAIDAIQKMNCLIKPLEMTNTLKGTRLGIYFKNLDKLTYEHNRTRIISNYSRVKLDHSL